MRPYPAVNGERQTESKSERAAQANDDGGSRVVEIAVDLIDTTTEGPSA